MKQSSSAYVASGAGTPVKITAPWAGRHPQFITKGQDVRFLAEDYIFDFYEGAPENISIYSNVIYFPQYHCLYTSDGKRIDRSCYMTRLSQTPQQVEVPPFLNQCDRSFVYVGDYTANCHFGHFLIEAISPLWYLLQHPETDVLCHEVPRLFKPTFIDAFLHLAGFKRNRFYSFEKPVQVKEVIIPDPSVYFGKNGYTIHQSVPGKVAANLLARIKQPGNSTTQQPLYFSRARLQNGNRKIEGEQALEQLLRGAGAAIAYPETLSLAQQVLLINRHQVIIGTSGSALHNILFDVTGNKKLVCIEDTDVLDRNFLIVDAIMHLDSVYIGAMRRSAITRPANRFVNRVVDVAFVEQSLQALGLW